MEYVRHIPRSLKKLHKNVTPINSKGSWVTNYNKVDYLDLTSGIGALSVGHSHPRIIDAVKKQVEKYVHMPQQIFKTHPVQNELNKKMYNIMPSKELDTFFYCNSGSEAVDNALKLARNFTNRQGIITLNKAFHGRTIGALSVTSSNLSCRKSTFPLMPSVFVCPEPSIKALNNLLEFHISPNETAAIIIETTQGEGGIFTVPDHFIHYVRDVCCTHNIVLIIDEVQCGSGRTGTWWNIEKKKVIPDLMIFGKGIAGGFPFAGIAGLSSIMNYSENFLGGTYGGNAISSIAASTTIDIINEEKLLLNCEKQGNYLSVQLKGNKFIKQVRQYGLMIAIEFKTDNNLIDARNIVQDLNDLNILTLLCGNKNQYIRLLPPLNIKKEEIDMFIVALNNVLSFYNKYH